MLSCNLPMYDVTLHCTNRQNGRPYHDIWLLRHSSN
uniref:Uncharacterized protein n=1 Tax=Rhizophora mucronata TaxID=61149 RepID=A0A2P2P7B9_RHIMU